MGRRNQDSVSYCADMVKCAHESRFLALQFAKAQHRPSLMALAAFFVELERIPASVSEPPLGEIRCQWWRDALKEILEGQSPRAHPVVQGLALLHGDRSDILARPEVNDAINAIAARLYMAQKISPEAALENFKQVDAAWLTLSLAILDDAFEVDEQWRAVAALAGMSHELCLPSPQGLALGFHHAVPGDAETLSLLSKQWHDIKPQLDKAPTEIMPVIASFSVIPTNIDLAKNGISRRKIKNNPARLLWTVLTGKF